MASKTPSAELLDLLNQAIAREIQVSGAIHVAARPLERGKGVRGEGRVQDDRHRGDEARRGDRGAAELPRGNSHHEAVADLHRAPR